MNEDLERRETINFVLRSIVSAQWLLYQFILERLELIEHEAEPLIVLLWYRARIQQGPAQVVPLNINWLISFQVVFWLKKL